MGVGPEGVPDLDTDAGQRLAVERPVVELDPALVDLHVGSDRLRRLEAAGERAADDAIDARQRLADQHRLLHPDIIERKVEPSEQAPRRVRLGAGVADEDQHTPDSTTDTVTIDTVTMRRSSAAGALQCGAPAVCATSHPPSLPVRRN